MGVVLIAQPPSGFYLRARFANHHTAGYVFHRDDAEGHPEGILSANPRVWWFHERHEWISWRQLLDFVAASPERLILEPLFAPPLPSGCQVDGMHSESCNREPGLVQ